MISHELLTFIDGLRGHIAEVTGWNRSACWPTRELLLENLRDNAARGLWGARWESDHASCESRLKAKGWIIERACSEKCHARHVMLSPAGERELERMNDEGCEHHGRRERGARRCHQRKAFGFKRAA